MERDRDHLGCRLEIVESSAASLEIGNAAPLPISAHLDLLPLGQADGALTASVACRPGLYGKVGRRIDDDFCALHGQAVLACCKFGPGAGYVEIDMRSTMQPILRALAAGVFHHIVAFQCRHINYCSRGYKVYVCRQGPRSFIGAKILACRFVDGGVRNDITAKMRGITVIIIVESVKRYIAGNDFLRASLIGQAPQGKQCCYGLKCKSARYG